MNESLAQPIEWEKGQNDLEYFGGLSYEELFEVLKDEEVASYYASVVTYQQESRVYRPNPESPTGDGFEVRPETKIIFTVGDGVNSNMRLAKDLTGRCVRTKKSDGRKTEVEAFRALQMANYKAAECDEVRATISFYLDGENNITADMAFAEISDVFYNLFHLETTDPENIKEYREWEKTLLQTLGITRVQMIQLMAAKYHFRLFRNEGRNGFEEEDRLIKDVLNEIYGDMEEVYLRERASNFLTLADILFEKVLKKRLTKLQTEFRRSEADEVEAEVNIKLPMPRKLAKKIEKFLRGQRVDKAIKRVIRGESGDIVFEITDEEMFDMTRMAATISLILTRVEEYQPENEDKQETK